MIFSRRTPADLAENPLARALRERSDPPDDLTFSNPTLAGLSPSDEEVREAFARGPSGIYRPAPTGSQSAREAVSAYYARRGADIRPERLVLAASTSEAYGYLFKLLANAGDTVLIPEPSYPLFEHLIQLEGLVEMAYPIRPSPLDRRWSIDLSGIERGLDAGARTVLSVHPNNPTGNFVKPRERKALMALLDPARHALISDEVFFDFPVEGGERAGIAAAAPEGPLAFSLGGLSKACGLPQVKLAWIAVGGDPAAAAAALERLEIVADTYLSVSTPVQEALPRLFEIGETAAERIRRRIIGNLAALDRAIGASAEVSRHPVEGGWSAVVQVADWRGPDIALFLLETAGVLVQPAWFFNWAREGAFVVSLLPESASFEECCRRVFAAITGRR